jgi:VWFA-related protein
MRIGFVIRGVFAGAGWWRREGRRSALERGGSGFQERGSEFEGNASSLAGNASTLVGAVSDFAGKASPLEGVSYRVGKLEKLQVAGLSRCIWVAVFLLLAVGGANVCGQQPAPQPQQPQPQQQPQGQQPQATPQPQPAQKPAGQQGPEAKIAVEVKTVSVLATVRDKHGKIISDLKKEDFAIEEDGKARTIDYFARESDLPLRLGLLVDTSLSQRKVLEQERSASYSFLDHLLRESKDLAFVIHFDREVELLQDFTPSRPKLQAALQTLQTPQSDYGGGGGGGGGSGGSGGGGGGGRGSRQHGGGTQLYDAIYLAADELMSKQQGRKAVIILSDGVDHGSKETLRDAIETAQRADTVVYSILFKDDEGYGNRGGGMGPYGGGGRRGGGGRYPQQQDRPDGKKILQEISKATGGRLYEVSKKETVEKIYAEIEEELRNQYSLGYTPPKSEETGYHKIVVTTKDKEMVVQARDGYYLGR